METSESKSNKKRTIIEIVVGAIISVISVLTGISFS